MKNRLLRKAKNIKDNNSPGPGYYYSNELHDQLMKKIKKPQSKNQSSFSFNKQPRNILPSYNSRSSLNASSLVPISKKFC
mmetsp:Transcript_32859/g.29156  ORF Transcript_32859/g.29156 Transcript_32859/m.29156 type:complete len:80 (+) Transcript_32859:651-890(+)